MFMWRDVDIQSDVDVGFHGDLHGALLFISLHDDIQELKQFEWWWWWWEGKDYFKIYKRFNLLCGKRINSYNNIMLLLN